MPGPSSLMSIAQPLSTRRQQTVTLLRAGQVVTQRRLLAAGWGRSEADPQYLRVYIGLLRQKLESNPAEPELLLTEPGVGYRLAAG